MAMVPSLEMNLWVFVWDERDFACSWIWFSSCFYWAALVFFSLVMILFPRQTFVSCRKGKYSMMIA
jgi:hypothetical protein